MWLALIGVANLVSAQPLIPYDDATLTRRLSSVADLVENREWDRAIEILETTISTSREQVVAVSGDHYLNGSEYARVLLTQLPAAGLTQYRLRKEPQASEWLRKAITNRDPRLLEAIVQEAFLTRSAEQALLLLGEWSFQAGNYAQARRWWTMLVPIELLPGRPSTVVRFPDPQTPLADVLARLILCSILEKKSQQASWELRFLSERFPEAIGQLAGEQGVWSEILAKFFERQLTEVDSDLEKVLPTLEVGRPLWRAPYQPGSGSAKSDIIPSLSSDIILWNTHRELYAAQIETGQPAWITTPARTPEKWFRLSRLFPPGPRTASEIGENEIVGSTTAMVTISDGRAYYRSGGPVSAYSPSEFRRTNSSLVCLDLEEGEGLLRWKVDTDTLDNEARLRFAGPPIVRDDRVYVLGRRGLLPSELHLICLNRDDGQFLWNRFVCSNSPSVPENANLAECLHLTVAHSQIVIGSKLGCIASFSLPEGRPLWYRTYSIDNESERRNLFPGSYERALIHEDLVVTAPGDGHEVFALDLPTGDTIWAQATEGREEILGTYDAFLVTSGDELICRHLSDGQIIWKYSPTHAEDQLIGRPLVLGQDVWWPTQREILVFDVRSGVLTRRIPLADRDSLSGGTVLTDGAHLILSGSRGVNVFSPYGWAPSKK